MEFDIGEFYEKFSSHFNLNLEWTIVITTLHKHLHV
jgi:hypothetical protein